jgi:hypothetical protein
MLLEVFAFLLGVLILYSFWRPARFEGATNFVPYTEQEMDKLIKNEANIKALDEKMDEILRLAAIIPELRAKSDANTKSIQALLRPQPPA